MTEISHPYQGKVRLRACGVLFKDEKLLLLKLRSPVTGENIWTLPGGGIKFGETVSETISREIHEETGIIVTVGKLIYINEIIRNNFHAVEMYHSVKQIGGDLQLGSDPEWDEDKQILLDAGFFTYEQISQMEISPEYFKKKFWEEKAHSL